MIIIYYKNDPDQGCIIRPTPLISISHTPIKNKIGTMGSNYAITLTGTIIADEGSPIYKSNGNSLFGPDNKFNQIGPNYDGNIPGDYTRPAHEDQVNHGNKLSSIFTKQQAIRELFALDGQKMEILPITGDEPILILYPRVESINFEEGIYVDICRYTINLVADTILDNENKVFIDGGIFTTSPSGTETDGSDFYNTQRKTELELINEFGGFVEDFNDTWAIEVDESTGETPITIDGNTKNIPRSYRITRNISATGKTSYIPSGQEVVRFEAWEQAKNFITKSIIQSANGYQDYPGYQLAKKYGDSFLDIPDVYKGYNHLRTENIDKANGSYSISDTWLMASGDKALETYNMSVQSSIDSPFIRVSIDGSIRGLSDMAANEYVAGSVTTTPYEKALEKYNEISNNKQFGVNANIYKRANNLVVQTLNSQPASISLGTNEFTGEITYNLEFNNRPTNYFNGVLGENISVNDTYPGDVYAIIPVLGRTTGPILQYIGGRTEYKRDVTIEIILDYTDIGYNNDRESFVLKKPSLNDPIRTQLLNLINNLSPSSEPGIRKYFLNPPSESWSPKEGRYTISLSWVYELSY